MKTTTLGFLATLGLLLPLSACGGGDAGTTSPESPAAETPAMSPASPAMSPASPAASPKSP